LPESLIDKDRPARWRGSENSILRPFQYPVLKVLARLFYQVKSLFPNFRTSVSARNGN